MTKLCQIANRRHILDRNRRFIVLRHRRFPYGGQDDTRSIKNAGNDKEYEYIICFTINRDWNFADYNDMLHIN